MTTEGDLCYNIDVVREKVMPMSSPKGMNTMDNYLETIVETRKRSSKKPISYILLVKIPAYVIATIISIAMLPITIVMVNICYIWNALKRCYRPEDQIRMVKNMYWGG